MGLINLISRELVLTATQSNRRQSQGSPLEVSEKGKKIYDIITSMNLDELDEGLEGKMYDLVAELTNEDLPKLERNPNTGEPAKHSLIYSISNEQRDCDEGDLLIYLGDGEALKEDETKMENFDNELAWRYATDDEIQNFFRM
jgi:hypothetical protein